MSLLGRLRRPKYTVDDGRKMDEVLLEIDGYARESSEKMMLELADKRDSGKPFKVKLFGGATVRISLFKVCRGYARLAPPATPLAQDYHWHTGRRRSCQRGLQPNPNRSPRSLPSAICASRASSCATWTRPPTPAPAPAR